MWGTRNKRVSSGLPSQGEMLIIQLHWLMILEARYDEDDEAIAILGHPKIDFEASCR
jgi:hypothetical protein